MRQAKRRQDDNRHRENRAHPADREEEKGNVQVKQRQKRAETRGAAGTGSRGEMREGAGHGADGSIRRYTAQDGGKASVRALFPASGFWARLAP